MPHDIPMQHTRRYELKLLHNATHGYVTLLRYKFNGCSVINAYIGPRMSNWFASRRGANNVARTGYPIHYELGYPVSGCKDSGNPSTNCYVDVWLSMKVRVRLVMYDDRQGHSRSRLVTQV